MKCRRLNYLTRDCKAPSRAKTPLFPKNANQKPVQKQRKFNNGDVKIPNVGSEKDTGNE